MVKILPGHQKCDGMTGMTDGTNTVCSRWGTTKHRQSMHLYIFRYGLIVQPIRYRSNIGHVDGCWLAGVKTRWCTECCFNCLGRFRVIMDNIHEAFMYERPGVMMGVCHLHRYICFPRIFMEMLTLPVIDFKIGITCLF